MQNLFTDTRQRLTHETHSRAQQKKFHDQHSHPVIFDIGSKVWLYHPAIPKGSTKKFASPWKGPYMKLDKINDVNYRIQSLSTRKQLTVHVNRLKLWHGQTTLDSMDADLSLPRITDDSGAVAKARWQPNHPSPTGIVVYSGQPTTTVVHSEQPTNTMVSSRHPTTTVVSSEQPTDAVVSF